MLTIDTVPAKLNVSCCWGLVTCSFAYSPRVHHHIACTMNPGRPWALTWDFDGQHNGRVTHKEMRKYTSKYNLKDLYLNSTLRIFIADLWIMINLATWQYGPIYLELYGPTYRDRLYGPILTWRRTLAGYTFTDLFYISSVAFHPSSIIYGKVDFICISIPNVVRYFSLGISYAPTHQPF